VPDAAAEAARARSEGLTAALPTVLDRAQRLNETLAAVGGASLCSADVAAAFGRDGNGCGAAVGEVQAGQLLSLLRVQQQQQQQQQSAVVRCGAVDLLAVPLHSRSVSYNSKHLRVCRADCDLKLTAVYQQAQCCTRCVQLLDIMYRSESEF
jgi:hypothetical protein